MTYSQSDLEFYPPMCQKAWRAHDGIITSIKCVNSRNPDINEFILTASSDWCCRLWTIDGSYIGCFGQERKWNLMDSKSFHYAVSADPALETLNLTITLSLKRKEKKPRANKKVFYFIAPL